MVRFNEILARQVIHRKVREKYTEGLVVLAVTLVVDD